MDGRPDCGTRVPVRHPGIGTATGEPDVYRFLLSRYSYTLFFRLSGSRDVIEIVCVVHAARISSLEEIPDEKL